MDKDLEKQNQLLTFGYGLGILIPTLISVHGTGAGRVLLAVGVTLFGLWYVFSKERPSIAIAAVWGLAVQIFTAFNMIKHGGGWISGVLLLASLFCLIVSLINIEWLRPLYVQWMKVASLIGSVVGTLLWGVIFYGVFTPVGLFFRLTGKDELHRKLDPQAQTYWNKREAGKFDKDRCLKQF